MKKHHGFGLHLLGKGFVMFKNRLVPLFISVLMIVFFTAGCENTEHLRKAWNLKKLAGDNRDNYRQAIEQYQKFLAQYPESKKQEAVKAEIADCYFKWAESEKQLKHWEKGVDLMQKVLDDYPDTIVAEKAEDALPEFLLEWGSQYSHEGKFLESLAVLKRLILHFPASGYAQEGRKIRKSIGIIAFNGGNDIYVMNADGSKIRRIAEMSIDPTISPDGTKIAYIKINKPGDRIGYLYISNIDGRRATQLLDKPIASEPKFSPDGTNILITKGDAFQKVDLSGRTIDAYFGIKDFDTIGSYNPTGKKVVAFLQHPKGKISRLCVTEDFEEYTELTTTESDPIRDAAWSMDDLRIAFVTGKGLNTISPEGDNLQSFINSEDYDNLDIRSVDIAPTGRNLILIAKKQSDAEFKLYYVTLDKEIHEMTLQATKDGTVPQANPGRVSWGKGYLRY